MPTKIFIIGLQPPPVHGLSAINHAMLELLRARNTKAVCIDLSAGNARGIRFAVLRVWRALTGLLGYTCGAFKERHFTTYLALSGGSGQVIDLAFLTAARLYGSRIFVHHHTYGYFESRHTLTEAIIWICGPKATHIVLCEQMRAALKSNYGADVGVEVISNAGILPMQTAETEQRARVLSVGFLSNVTTGKGIEEFFEVAEQIGKVHPRIRFRIAGPIREPGLEQRFSQLLAALPNVEYVGPVYGEAKMDFLRSMDVLLFPTHLPEGEPLTIYEAFGSGTPVIANGSGCIGSLIPENAGLVVRDDNFVQLACDQICMWLDSPSDFTRTSACARGYFLALQSSQKSAVDRLLSQLVTTRTYS
jgi:glycosyltransferase involved in cell wall biosynthesis